MTPEIQHHVHLAVRRGTVIGRRDFLRSLSAFSLAGAWSWADVVGARAAELRKEGRACILLWMQGGPSQFETFSPKPGHANGGPTRAISTAVPGLELSENFPHLAKQMQHVALVRSMTSKEGSHPRASFLMHTGYLPTASVQYPALGSVAAQQLGDPASDLPNFVRIGSRLRNSGNGGLLGVAYDAFEMTRAGSLPDNAAPNVDAGRSARRLALRDKLDGLGSRLPAERAQDQKSLYGRTARMIGSRRMTAFELEREPQKMREAYGEGDFASGCLLARRLIESGVTFVEVSAGNWDTHQDNFEQSKSLAGEVDRPTAQLIADLAARGLLEKTLVVWMGEFGRTPRINARTGRDHFPRAFNLALAGGGVRGGQVIGKTDAGGTEVTERPVAVPDLFQSLCHSLGIDPNAENTTSSGRPIKVVDKGSVVRELFS